MRYSNRHSIKQDKQQDAYKAVMRDIKRDAETATDAELQQRLGAAGISMVEANQIRKELMRRSGALA